MRYQLFISYSSVDRPWAEKLWQDLKGQFDVFWDQNELRLGEKWNPQLRDALDNSQHMVIFWSDAATLSEWVQSERAGFMASDPKAAEDQTRRIIVISLQGESKVLSAYQGMVDLRDGGFYVPGGKLPAENQTFDETWKRVVNKLKAAITGAADAIPIWLMLFTLTRKEFESIDPTNAPVWGPSLEGLLEDLQIAPVKPGGLRRDALLDSYKSVRNNWAPFGQHATTIQQIADDALMELNANEGVKAHKVQFRWEPVGEDFWQVGQSYVQRDQFLKIRQRYMQQMLSGRSLIVIDPIAFYAREGKYFFEQFSKCLANEKALVLIVPPFSTCSARLRIRTLIQQVTQDFIPYYEPPIPAQKFAALGLGITDKDEMQRFLRMAVAQHVSSLVTTRPSSPALRHR